MGYAGLRIKTNSHSIRTVEATYLKPTVTP